MLYRIDMDDLEEYLKVIQVQNILKSHKIEMNIWGCGCCGSPVVSFKYEGKSILSEESDFELKMF